MAKIAAVTAAALCLAALLAVAVGQGEVKRQRIRDLRCWQEVQQSPLDACMQVLDRQLTGGMRYGVGPYRWGTGLRMRCCQQLQDVSRECRCAAVRQMVRGYEETMPMPSLPPPEERWGQKRPQGGQGYEQQRFPPFGAGGAGQQQPLGGEGGGQGYYPGSQAGEGYGESQEMYPPCRPGTGTGTGRRMARVRLMKARQYAMGLPIMCRLEPQECSVFSGGDQYY